MQGLYPQADGSVLVEGAMPVSDLNHAMAWNLPDEQATTIAGLLIHDAATIPDTGQMFTFHGFRFSIICKIRNRIAVVRVTPENREEQHARL